MRGEKFHWRCNLWLKKKLAFKGLDWLHPHSKHLNLFDQECEKTTFDSFLKLIIIHREINNISFSKVTVHLDINILR